MRVNNTRVWWTLIYDQENRKAFEKAVIDNRYGEHKPDTMFAVNEYGDYIDEGLQNVFVGWCLQIAVTRKENEGDTND